MCHEIHSRMIVNVIHPWTYKLNGDKLEIGAIRKYSKRDNKVSDFVRACTESGIQIVCHESYYDMIRNMMEMGAIYSDKKFAPLFDGCVKWVTTTLGGIPLVDEKPAS